MGVWVEIRSMADSHSFKNNLAEVEEVVSARCYKVPHGVKSYQISEGWAIILENPLSICGPPGFEPQTLNVTRASIQEKVEANFLLPLPNGIVRSRRRLAGGRGTPLGKILSRLKDIEDDPKK